MATDPRVDAYLAALPSDQQLALQKLRAQLAHLVPEAAETISYGMPAVTSHGRVVITFAAWKAHLSLYPLPAAFLAVHADELKPFRGSKSSVHFTPKKPLPDELLAGLVRQRLADVEGSGR